MTVGQTRTALTRRRGATAATAATAALSLLALAACGSSSKATTTPPAATGAATTTGAAAPTTGAAAPTTGAGAASSGDTSANTASAPGITATTVTVGTHQPLTGPAAPGYSEIAKATQAYFDYVNAAGGVNGRMLTDKIMDDGYNPANTSTVVKNLVLNDKVFSILDGLGTPTHTAVLDFLKTNKVPDLFVASGSHSWNQATKYPDTFGWQPEYKVEGKILGDYVKQNFAGKKICSFGQGDDFGTDGAAGVEQALGASLTHKETYTPTNTNVAPQVQALKAAGCEVVVSFTVPGFTALAIGTGAASGFTPQYVISNVGADYVTLSGFLKDKTAALLEGAITDDYVPLANDTSNPWIQLFTKISTMYDGGQKMDGNVEYGMAVGYTFVQALQAAGQNPTRESLEKAVEAGGFTGGPGLTPFNYSGTNHSGYSGTQIVKIAGGVPAFVGSVKTTDDGSGAITEVSTPAATPPASGIPG